VLDRSVLLAQMRRAHLRGGLQFNSALESAAALYTAVHRITFRNAIADPAALRSSRCSPEAVEDEGMVIEFTKRSAVAGVAAARSSSDTLMRMREQVGLTMSFNREIAAMPRYRNAGSLALRHDGYGEWQWPFILNR
jgi:hypothetical protein